MFVPRDVDKMPPKVSANDQWQKEFMGRSDNRTALENAQRRRAAPEFNFAALSNLGPNDILAWLRDSWLIILTTTLFALAGTLVYSLSATERFTAYTDILVDPANLNVVNDDVFLNNPLRDAQLMEVESKMRILTSRNVLARVIEKMNLTEDDEFIKPPSIFSIASWFARQADGNKTLAVMRELSGRVEAKREERSFVVVLEVWSETPDKAVALSQAIVDAFEEELFRSAADSAGRVADNLSGRLNQLRARVTEAERRVEEFRLTNGLQENNGELVSNQRSAALNTQVLTAQQRVIDATSRFQQMSSAIKSGQVAGAAIFDSQTMTELREQYNAIQQQIGSLGRTFGQRHPRMVSALSERQALEEAIVREARRILAIAKADVAREQEAFDALQGKANQERSKVFSDNAAQVELRDLEREARSRAAIYETYLARTQQIAERQQIDATNVRIISSPVPPKARSWPPRTLVLLVVALMAGVAMGVGLATLVGLYRHVRRPSPATAPTLQ